MKRNQVIDKLKNLSEDNYKKFNQKIIPGADNILGVRMDKLKKLAKKIAQEDYIVYLNQINSTPNKELYYEEIMIQGLIIGLIKVDLNERILLIEDFIPRINNWAICDCFCAGLKFTKNYKEEMWLLINNCIKQDKEYIVRFGVVMVINYFSDEPYFQKSLQILEKVNNEGYYVKMAVSWAISVFYIKRPEEIKLFLEKPENLLDDFTYNKAIQKIRESYRVTKEEKDYLKQLKRKMKK